MVEWITAEGLTDYDEAVAFMEARAEAIAKGEAEELIWLVEHPPLYTAGTSAKPADLTDPDLRRTTAEVDEDARWFRMDRGSLVVLAAFGEEATIPLPDGTYEVVWATPTPVSLGLGEVRAPRHSGGVLRRL